MSGFKKNYRILAIGDIRLQMIEDSRIKKRLARNNDTIEEIWQLALKDTSGKLFNRTLANFISVNIKEQIEIVAHFIEYKYFLAQIKRPDLNLGIRPIGVSGITVLKGKNGKDHVVFAERTGDATEYPTFFELVPSGSIDKEYVDTCGMIDYKSKLLAEFVEETGASKDFIEEISDFAFVLDTNHKVYDICCKILIEAERDAVARVFSGSKEYRKFAFVSISELNKFVNENAARIVPASMAIIEAYRQV